jgi:hypothetical protein
MLAAGSRGNVRAAMADLEMGLGRALGLSDGAEPRHKSPIILTAQDCAPVLRMLERPLPFRTSVERVPD